MLESEGITATIIRAGKHKAKPNQLEALDATTLARVQASIDHTHELFIATVARNRGLNSDAVRNTEAATFGADAAIEIGLADAMQAPLEALEAFKRELSGSTLVGATVMTVENLPAADAQAGQAASTYTQAQLNEATAAATAAATTAGIEQGATAERERIFAIIECAEATGRAASAAHLAKQPGMTGETAAGILGGLAEEAQNPGAGASADALSAAMALTGGGANVGAGEGDEHGDTAMAVIDSDAIYAKLNAG
jgi:ClpP class serine protease